MVLIKTGKPTRGEPLLLHDLCGAVDQASSEHAQCGLLVLRAGLVEGGGQGQTEVGHARLLLSVLSERVAQLLGECQPERRTGELHQNRVTVWIRAFLVVNILGYSPDKKYFLLLIIY